MWYTHCIIVGRTDGILTANTCIKAGKMVFSEDIGRRLCDMERRDDVLTELGQDRSCTTRAWPEMWVPKG